jgi:hypothetical protein
MICYDIINQKQNLLTPKKTIGDLMMKDLIPRLVALSISLIIFMTISIKFGWSAKLWSVLINKVKPQHTVLLWLIFVCVFNIMVQILFEMAGIAYNEILNGAITGFTFAFMPDLGKTQK